MPTLTLTLTLTLSLSLRLRLSLLSRSLSVALALTWRKAESTQAATPHALGDAMLVPWYCALP